jgi:hypothetical protein
MPEQYLLSADNSKMRQAFQRHPRIQLLLCVWSVSNRFDPTRCEPVRSGPFDSAASSVKRGTRFLLLSAFLPSPTGGATGIHSAVTGLRPVRNIGAETSAKGHAAGLGSLPGARGHRPAGARETDKSNRSSAAAAFGSRLSLTNPHRPSQTCTRRRGRRESHHCCSDERFFWHRGKRHAPTCCAASAETRKPRRPMTPPARSPPTRSSRLSSTRNDLRFPGRPLRPAVIHLHRNENRRQALTRAGHTARPRVDVTLSAGFPHGPLPALPRAPAPADRR